VHLDGYYFHVTQLIRHTILTGVPLKRTFHAWMAFPRVKKISRIMGLKAQFKQAKFFINSKSTPYQGGALVPRKLPGRSLCSQHHLDATLALAGGLWRSTLAVT